MNYIAHEDNKTLLITVDDEPFDPRKDFSNLSTFYCWHSNYNLGDHHDYKSKDDLLEHLVYQSASPEEVVRAVQEGKLEGLKITESDGYNLLSYDNIVKVWFEVLAEGKEDVVDLFPAIISEMRTKDLLHLAEKSAVIEPLYLMDHSGISMSTSPYSCPWDSGQVGFAVITHEEIIQEFGEVTKDTLTQAKANIEGEVSDYDLYLTGEVYYYQYHEDGELVSSCGGLCGDVDDIVEYIHGDIPESGEFLLDNLKEISDKEVGHWLWYIEEMCEEVER